jgi:uncharacterized protein YkwD
MIKFSFLLLLFTTTFASYSQSVFDAVDTLNYPYHLWNKEVIEAANTAKESAFLTQQEKDIVWLTNLVRFDGALFAKTFLKEYVDKHQVPEAENLKSLNKELRRINQLPLLMVDRNIVNLASEFALESGIKGSVGHQKFSTRVKKSRHARFAENCHYGQDTSALTVLISLLIDEDVASLGHRKNILDPKMLYIGLAIRPHKIHKYVCVIEYGG